MQRLRIGIVGCGEVTQIMHLPSLYQLAQQFAVTALCDVSNQVLQAVGEQWRVPKRYRDYQDLLAQDDVDAVLVANPDAYHATVTLAAIAAGKKVRRALSAATTSLQTSSRLANSAGLSSWPRHLAKRRPNCALPTR